MRFCQAMIGARPEHWARLAVAAEAAGFDSVAVSDHVVYPSYLGSRYPYTPDGTPLFPCPPWAWEHYNLSRMPNCSLAEVTPISSANSWSCPSTRRVLNLPISIPTSP